MSNHSLRIANMMRTVSILYILMFTGVVHGENQPTLVDMSYPFSMDTLYWPNSPIGFQYKFYQNDSSFGFWYESGEFRAPDHGGTHLDAPIHMFAGKWSLHEIPPNHLVAPGSVIDVSQKRGTTEDYQLTTQDITDWEAKHGSIANTIVLVNFGWEQYYNNRTHYFAGQSGSLGPHGNDTSNLHFPGIHPDTAKWIVDNRPSVYGIGLDTPSLDYGPSQDFMTHRHIFEKNIYGLENVRNLNELPATGAKIMALPMKIENGSGGPCRIIAEIRLAPVGAAGTMRDTVVSCVIVAMATVLFQL